MKHLAVTLAIVSTVFLGGITVYAQTSISGDSLCGSSTTTACNFTHLGQMVKGLMFFIIGIGLPLLIAIIAYRFVMAWFAAAQGQTGAYKEAAKKAAQSVLGFLILIALFGGVLTVLLKYLGATDDVFKILDLIKTAFIPTAHAQQTMLPTPIQDTNIYDFMLKILALVIRFFIYPALIVIWVWTGFSFVLAQGKPDALSKAKKLLVWATISTFVVVMVQVFLFAAKGTVEEILPGSTSGQASGQTSGQTIQGQPVTGTGASQCLSSGGVVGPDGVSCTPASSRAGSSAADYCSGKQQGTLCTIPASSGAQTGVCKKDTVVSCFKANEGDYCLTTSGQPGKIGASNECLFSQSAQQEVIQELVKEELPLPENADGFLYDVSGGGFTLVKKPQYVTENKERHQRVWELFKKANPQAVVALIKDVKIYYIKDGSFDCGQSSMCSNNDVLAEIVQKGYPKGYFGLEVNLYNYLLENGSLDEDELVPIMIHEGAHVLSFSANQVATEHDSIEGLLKECKTLARTSWVEKQYICLKSEAYLSKFTEKFYTTFDAVRFTPKVDRDDAFVSEYARVRAIEDFAEVYKRFIMDDRPSFNPENTAAEKIAFLYNFSDLVSFRSDVRSRFGL